MPPPIATLLGSRTLRAVAIGGGLALIAFLGLAISPFVRAAHAARRHAGHGRSHHARRAGYHPRGERTFYVSPSGRDSSSGHSPSHPWRTVGRVDRARLRPGDRVLFQGGASFADNTLMPGWGFGASGTARARITFSSYGGGVARLDKGVWLGTDSSHPYGPSYLNFRNLAIGPRQGFQGTANHITLEHLRITDLMPGVSTAEVAIETEGSHWVIAHNYINRTGDSGMLLGFNANSPGNPPGGYHYRVYGNVITNTGLNANLGYAAHGIYLKVADAYVAYNQIVRYAADGVSVRYRNATVVHNQISDGSIGIAWYQYDSRHGLSRFTRNLITTTSDAGIFVCGANEGCLRPLETFVVAHNRVITAHGVRLNLQPTAGHYLAR